MYVCMHAQIQTYIHMYNVHACVHMSRNICTSACMYTCMYTRQVRYTQRPHVHADGLWASDFEDHPADVEMLSATQTKVEYGSPLLRQISSSRSRLVTAGTRPLHKFNSHEDGPRSSSPNTFLRNICSQFLRTVPKQFETGTSRTDV
jgi:hypothetical protein